MESSAIATRREKVGVILARTHEGRIGEGCATPPENFITAAVITTPESAILTTVIRVLCMGQQLTRRSADSQGSSNTTSCGVDMLFGVLMSRWTGPAAKGP